MQDNNLSTIDHSNVHAETRPAHWVTSILHLGLCEIWLFAAKGVVVH